MAASAVGSVMMLSASLLPEMSRPALSQCASVTPSAGIVVGGAELELQVHGLGQVVELEYALAAAQDRRIGIGLHVLAVDQAVRAVAARTEDVAAEVVDLAVVGSVYSACECSLSASTIIVSVRPSRCST